MKLSFYSIFGRPFTLLWSFIQFSATKLNSSYFTVSNFAVRVYFCFICIINFVISLIDFSFPCLFLRYWCKKTHRFSYITIKLSFYSIFGLPFTLLWSLTPFSATKLNSLYFPLSNFAVRVVFCFFNRFRIHIFFIHLFYGDFPRIFLWYRSDITTRCHSKQFALYNCTVTKIWGWRICSLHCTTILSQGLH